MVKNLTIRHLIGQIHQMFGGQGWIRTSGLRGFKPTLFQLSYLTKNPHSKTLRRASARR